MMYVQVHELSNMELRAPLPNNNGIRLSEDFQIVFKLKRLWIFFSNCDSLWVAWLRNNIFKRNFWLTAFFKKKKNFWLTADSPCFSATI
ncbi:unnamed protein product, partial [Brassica rapa subsp. narinosa]